jgi:tetratricopeptide (TPR) repeat protein
MLIAAFVLSCSSTKSILVEIPQPSKKELPATIQSLTIVTQAVSSKHNNLTADSLQKIFYKENFRLDTVIYDSKVVDTTMIALGELLFESGRYDFVIPENRYISRVESSTFSVEMPWQMVNELCETYNTDAVLSIDHFTTRVVTDFNRESFYNPYDNNFYSGAKAEMKVIYDALFRVYEPATERVLVREYLTDTLFWNDSNPSLRELFENFTPVKQALYEAGIALALDFSDKISVIWKMHRRNYFHKGNAEFEKANQLVNAGDWETAISLWKNIAENSESKSLKSKAEYNTAVGYEMTGDLNQAISWALKSYETMFRTQTYDYLETLKNRKNDLKK